MHYSIFIPNMVGADPKKLNAVGLGHLLRDNDASPLMQEMPDKGPSGGPGLLFVWPPHQPHFHPGELTWYPAKADKANSQAAGRFWYGINPHELPTPAELAFKEQLKGNVLLLEGNLWRIPNILLLPHKFAFDADGEEMREVMSSHRAIYDRGMWAYELLRKQIQDGEPAPGKELRAYIVEMLSLNYRIFRDLAPHFDLLTDENWFTIACHTVDIETLLTIEDQVAKKKTD